MLYFGRTRSAVWIHFTVINLSGEQWYLLLDTLLGSEFDLYIRPEGADPTQVSAASTAQYAQPLENYRRKLWHTHFPQGQTLHVYMRATNGDAILRLPVEFLSSTAMLERSDQGSLLLGGLYVSLLLLALYQILMFASLRESSYLFLSAHILAMLATIHRTNPVFDSLAFLSQTDSFFFTAPMLVAISTYLLFSRQILDLPRDYPRLDRIYWLVALVILASSGVIGLIPGGTFIPVLLGLGLYFLEIPTSFWLASRGNKIAHYFALAHVVALLIQVGNGLLLVTVPQEWSPSSDLFAGLVSLQLVFPISWLQAMRVRGIRERAQKAEAQHKAKDEFLAVMSHELRTPLHAIVGLSGLLRMDTDDEKRAEYLERLNTAARHQLHLVGNILDIAKAATQTLQVERQAFRLDIAVNSVVDLVGQSARQKGLELVVEWRGDDLREIPLAGDRLRLTQVFMNLLGNAVKYTHYGHVTLTISLTPLPDGRYEVGFSVTDTGVGIPADKLGSLFEPFAQMAGQSALQQGGVGLGLAISKRLVEAMGGVLQAESRLDEGSRFYFTLILESATSLPATAATTIDQLPVGLRILLVDDSELNRFVGSEMLRNMGVQDITLAPDGESAILQLQQQDFDVVLLDISMPGMDGFEVTRWLRQHGRNPVVPVIALSGHVLEQIREEGRQVGMDAFLNKPFEYHELAEVIRQWLASTESFAHQGISPR